MLQLSSEYADGAHPYWTTPDHTHQAREILGKDKLLCVEQKVVLTQDKETAHSAAKSALRIYASLPNYRNSWKRLGFSEDDIDSPSDYFIDSLVALSKTQTPGCNTRLQISVWIEFLSIIAIYLFITVYSFKVNNNFVSFCNLYNRFQLNVF